MRKCCQTNGCKHPPARRKWNFPPGGGFRLAWVCAAAGLVLARPGSAQTFKLGPVAFDLIGRAEVGYDSNVDDIYPEEQKPGLQAGDFYWMPGLALRSHPLAMRPSTTLSLAGSYDYQDFFNRNDLDTEIYHAEVTFQTVHPRLTLGGLAGVDYDIQRVVDEYVPGGAERDPMLTHSANVFANWNHGKFRIETSADWTRDLHDYEKYQAADRIETILFAGAYLDLFTWGSLYYTVENTDTTLLQSEETDNKTDRELGLEGEIPFDLLRRPKITYSFGLESIDETGTGNDLSWEPVHTIRVSDEQQLTKTVLLRGYAEWIDDIDENTIEFQYSFTLSQQLGPRAEHALSFTQEPRPTFGSTSDTKTTTYQYDFRVRDLIFYNLSLLCSAMYEEDTPLEVASPLTEKTTTLTAGLDHTRQLSRKLARIISYEYTWEKSNFHVNGPKEKHVLSYGFTYTF